MLGLGHEFTILPPDRSRGLTGAWGPGLWLGEWMGA